MDSDNNHKEVVTIGPFDSRVLVVDDYPFILNLIKNYFSHNNYYVQTAQSGAETLQLIENEPEFDLIILDIMMPDMSGYDVCRQLREKYSLFELPILVLTAKDQLVDMLEGFEAGANDYLSKPFNRNELLARSKTLIKLKKLTKSNSVLQQAVDIKNQFLQMTIHDLKNPLTVILGMTAMMMTEIDKSSEHYSYLSLIQESSDLMYNLVNELLDGARIESGKLMLKRELLDLREITDQLLDKHNIHAMKKGQELIFAPKPKTKYNVFVDRIRIEEIIDNLISNAIKYSPHNRKISIFLRHKNGEHNQKFVEFEVKDEGPGLTDQDKTKLFGTFQRLSARPTGGESSTGLGLSIVKQLVELHDGKIWVESEHGKGCSFIFNLLAEEHAQS